MLLRKRKPTAAAVEETAKGRPRRVAGRRGLQSGAAATSDDPPAAPADTPVAAEATRSNQRKTPQDIGIPTLLLGGGMSVPAATEAIDHLPLAAAGFTKATLQAACEFLAKADPKLAPLIEQHGPPEHLLRKTGSNFATLAKAIAFQQLATNAAAAIYNRVLAACSCTDTLTPEALLAAPAGALRAAGLSERKAGYMADLARHFSDGRLSDDKIGAMEEAELEEALCAVKGIGLWTCHMHAMFHLGSPDVLPTGDLGVRRGMQHLYGLKELPSPTAMEAVAESWRPYRSLGTYFMWKVDVPRSSPGKSKKAKKKET